MKKKGLLLIPFAILLASCDQVTFGFSQGLHSAGMEGSFNTSSKKEAPDSYSYYAGDIIETEGKNEANITFTIDQTESFLDVSKLNDLITSDVDASELSITPKECANVGSNENNGLFIGADSTYVDGYLILGFDKAIKDIKIEASPYYYLKNAWNEDTLVIDQDVAISVNGSGYVKLSSELNESGDKVNLTTCRYHLSGNDNEVMIKVGPRRAFINKITLYY